MTKCRLHGGKSLVGPQNPHYKHGRYSKALPAQLMEHYHEARTSPQLLSLRDDIALAEARLGELLQTVESGAAGKTWQALRHSLAEFQAALGVGDVLEMNRHFAAIQELVQGGSRTAATWEEIRQTWAVRARLMATEMKTLQTMQQMVTTQQLMLFLGALTEVVTQAVKRHAEPRSQRAILQEIMVEFEALATQQERR